jgi:hypothetical protein
VNLCLGGLIAWIGDDIHSGCLLLGGESLTNFLDNILKRINIYAKYILLC